MRSIRLIDYFVRWRHGRGFGIHSPFAFRFVTDVLKERYAYYAYHKIAKHFVDEKSAKCPAISFRYAACIFRVINHMRPQRVMIIGEQDLSLFKDVVHYASKSIRITDTMSDADMIIISSDIDSDETANKRLCQAVAHNNATVIFTTRLTDAKEALWQQIIDSLNYGMSFTNTKSTPTILVANPKLPKQEFKVLF